MGPLCVYFEPSSWYLDISTVGEMVLSKHLAPKKVHLVLVRNWNYGSSHRLRLNNGYTKVLDT
jgi:hypothetical protein